MGQCEDEDLPIHWTAILRCVSVLGILGCCLLTLVARAQQSEPEDPEDEKKIGLWLDQGISTPLTTSKSLEVEYYERLDEGGSNLFEHFIQAGVAFRPRSWLTLIPIYRYQRFPGNPAITYENRLQFNVTLTTPRGPVAIQPTDLGRGTIPRRSSRFRAFSVPSWCRLHCAASYDLASGHRRKRRILHRSLDESFRQRRQRLHAKPLSDGRPDACHQFALRSALLSLTVSEPASWLGYQHHPRHLARL
jgi:hypothetical protein